MSTIVRLDRSTDRERPCCENLATINSGKGPHGAELRCARCGRHRGWLPKQATEFLATVSDRFGDPDPIILRDESIGDHVMQKYDNKNSGALFKNENKQSEKHADYRGEVNAAGVDYWLDGWVRTSKKSGTKFISFKLKPKQETSPAMKAPAEGFNDEVPF